MTDEMHPEWGSEPPKLSGLYWIILPSSPSVVQVCEVHDAGPAPTDKQFFSVIGDSMTWDIDCPGMELARWGPEITAP